MVGVCEMVAGYRKWKILIRLVRALLWRRIDEMRTQTC